MKKPCEGRPTPCVLFSNAATAGTYFCEWGLAMFRTVTGRNRLMICAAAAMMAATALPAYAQTQTFQFNIQPQPLDGALRAFARTTRLQVLFDEPVVRGRRSAALTGSHTAEDGIATLLAGSGLQARRGAQGAYVVKPAETAAAGPSPVADTVDEVVVTSYRYLSEDTSGTTGLPVPLEKVPQSISLVNQDFI